MAPESTTFLGRTALSIGDESRDKLKRPIKPAEPEVLIARQAAARVETEDGCHGIAAHRLTGAFDGDAEQRIALAVLDILRENDLLKQELC